LTLAREVSTFPRVRPRAHRIIVALAAAVGAVVGLGAFTFDYAEGFSYFSTEPRACANCHIMNDEYASWAKGPHHGAATCVQCHLPHDFVGKYLAKAENGYHHSKGFTLEDFHEPIQIKPHNAAILQANCLRCHGDFVHDIVQRNKTPRDGVSCVHCHRSAGHGAPH
jgi:cytochrome c nitrite reductase small subunit